MASGCSYVLGLRRDITAGVGILAEKLHVTQYSPLQRATLALFNDLLTQEVGNGMICKRILHVLVSLKFQNVMTF